MTDNKTITKHYRQEVADDRQEAKTITKHYRQEVADDRQEAKTTTNTLDKR